MNLFTSATFFVTISSLFSGISCVNVTNTCRTKNGQVRDVFKSEISKFTNQIDKVIECALKYQGRKPEFENCIVALNLQNEIESKIINVYYRHHLESDHRVKLWAIDVMNDYCDILKKRHAESDNSYSGNFDADVSFSFKSISLSPYYSPPVSVTTIVLMIIGAVFTIVILVVFLIFKLRRARNAKLDYEASNSNNSISNVAHDEHDDQATFAEEPPTYGQISGSSSFHPSQATSKSMQ